MQTIENWQAARRFKSVQYSVYAFSMLGAPLVLLLCTLLVPTPSSVRWLRDALHLHRTVLVYPLWAVCAGVFVLGCTALYRFYSPLPSLQGVSHRQRKLLGLPYSEGLLAQELRGAQSASATSAAADGMRKRSTLTSAALSTLADTAAPINPSSTPGRWAQPAPSASPSLSTPSKSGARPSYAGNGAMTDAKELQQFISQANQQALGQTPPPSTASSSFYSPYRPSSGWSAFGSGVNQTPPYATSVRSTLTLPRGGTAHSGALRSGRYALDDPRSDTESAERANEVGTRPALKLLNRHTPSHADGRTLCALCVCSCSMSWASRTPSICGRETSRRSDCVVLPCTRGEWMRVRH